jgi:hypothetical protein
MPEKMIPLADAFRLVLRAKYPQRPALADEIQNYHYFRYALIDKSTGLRADPEVQVADDAREALLDAIASQSIRLRGRLDNALPNDIDPTEVARNGIDVFDNALEVYEPSTRSSRFRMLRTYRNVHCYEGEIKTILNAAGDSSKRTGRRPAADWPVIADALRLEVDRRGMIGPDNDADWRIQADVEKWVSTLLQDRNETAAESTVRDRVRKMLKTF